MNQDTVQEICLYCNQQNVNYTIIYHSETHTSDESAFVRAEQGYTNVTGVKAILMKM